jgi:hypothetical protein
VLTENDIHTVPTSVPTLRHGRFVRAFQQTLRRIHATDNTVNSLCSYRTLARRNQGSRLGLSRKRGRVLDQCSVCFHWDTAQSKKMAGEFMTRRRTITSIMPSYFDNTPVHSSSLAENVPDVPELVNLVRFLKTHRNQRAGERALLTDAAKVKVAEEEKAFIQELEDKDTGAIDIINAYKLHWYARDMQKQHYGRCTTKPAPRTIYIHWDWQALFRTGKSTP